MNQRIIECHLCGQTKQSPFCELAHSGGGQVGRTQSRAVGQVLFYQDSPSESVFCISSGTVKLFKSLPTGDRQVIRLLGPGNVIGHRAILADEPYSATAEALETTNVCIVEREAFLALLNSSEWLKSILLRNLALELRQSEELLLSLARDRVEVRLAKFLLNILPVNRIELRSPVIQGIPRQEIALAVGVTPETLSRALRRLAERKLIGVNRTQIEILDLPKLQQLSRAV